ncbi:MAG: helix-turn-helix transcriptional regulator [Acidobacteria bacterium]|nr:helix-turn-helix transcriptional regulator [Acidobacteriota bacterium]
MTKERPGPRPRVLSAARWPGIEFFVKDQDISAETTWSIASDRHTVVVHLNGRIDRLETELEGAGAVLHPPMPGEVWVIPAGTRYSSHAHGKIVRYAELFIDPRLATQSAGGSVALQPVLAKAGYYDEFLFRAVERLDHLLHESGGLSEAVAESLSHTLCLHILHGYTSPTQSAPGTSPALRLGEREERRLRMFIEENLHSPIRLAHLASLAGMTVHDLLKAFRASFGATPAQYLIEQRIGRVRWMLRNTNRDITDIALEAGFANHSHLSNVFRRRVGVAPKEFRLADRAITRSSPTSPPDQLQPPGPDQSPLPPAGTPCPARR